MVVQIVVRYWNKILKSVSRDNMTISPKKYWIFHSRNTFTSSKLETKKTKYYFRIFFFFFFRFDSQLIPELNEKFSRSESTCQHRLRISKRSWKTVKYRYFVVIVKWHRWRNWIKNLFHFVSPFSLLSSFSPPPTTNPPSSVLLRRSADWHFDLSDATLEYSFSRRAAVLIVFADCNLIVRQRGNWKSVRERVSPILQNLPFESIDFNLSGAKPRNHPFLEPTKMRFRGGALIYRADSRSIVTSAAYLGSDLENFHDSFRSKDVIPHFINRFESLHGYGFEKPF